MIVFRCDANSRLGFGHLMRCRALAAALGALDRECVMVGPDASCQQAGDAKLFSHWVGLPWFGHPAADAADLAGIATKYRASALVLDDMRIDEGYQRVLAERGLRWLQFDGARGQPLWADLIVNASPAANANYYREHARNPEAHLLLGPAHAVVRPEFLHLPHTQPVTNEKRVLLMFGGGDDRGAIRMALQALHAALPSEICFDIIAGRQNPNHNAHRALVATLPVGRAQYHIDPPELPALMQGCRVAVMAGGTTTYEANLFGVPMVLVAIADNQIPQAHAWESQGQAIYVGELEELNPQRLVQATLEQLSRQSQPPKLVDGQGATRVAAAMVSALWSSAMPAAPAFA